MRWIALLGCTCLVACVSPRKGQPGIDAGNTDSTSEVEGGPGDDGGSNATDLAGAETPGADTGADAPASGADAGADVPADTRAEGGSPPPVDALPSDASRLANGTACTLGTACTSGLCVDGVCCESACAGQCEACAENNNQGKCVAVTGLPRGLRAACAGQGTPCAGTCGGSNGAACTYPGMEKDCAAASCQGGVALTRSVCDGKGACPAQTMVSCAPLACAGAICAGGCSAASPCTGDNYCSAGKCSPRKGLGVACAGNDECSGGRCVDGVCCDSPCDGACQTCNASGNAGHCGAVKSADDDRCFGATTCDASGVCKARAGSSCSGGADCATGFCVDGKCCGTSSCGPCQACTGGGGACVAVTSKDDDSCAGTCDATGNCRAKKGQLCAAAPGGCISGTTCADGYCCDSACAGTCMACDLPAALGTCTAVPSGSPHAGRGTCGTGTCAGACAGRVDGQCQFPTGTCGGAAGCQGNMLVAQGMCMSGSCVTPPPQTCQGGCTGNICVNVSKIVSHGSTNCALLSDGTVKCWGSDGDGQLGDGGPIDMFGKSATPVAVSGLTGVTTIAAGPNHFCALVAGGAIKCWGFNNTNQLGNGGTTDSPTPVSVTVSGAAPASQVVGAYYSTCSLVGTGVKCWGDNTDGELGDGSLGSLNATAIAAGYDHFCAIISGGTVKCWGANRDGQLGNATKNGSATPVTVITSMGGPPLTGVVSLAAGAFFTCAIVNGGAVKCWGHNQHGELGNGTATTPGADSSVPVNVMNLSGPAVSLAAGYYDTCAVISGGAVNCWGDNPEGQVGNGSSGNVAGIAQPVAGITGATGVAVGIDHACALVSDGVKCWGGNPTFQLGVTSPAMSTSPVTVGW
jgi:alpha-tubulin suppressor-like RCC1 family protein